MAEPALLSPAPTSRDIDLVHLARQTGGDRLLEREVLALFLKQCSRLLAVMSETGRSRAGLDAAHTLKGAARGVGAFRVADRAEMVEAAGEARFAAAIAELDAAVRDAGALIERLLANR